MEALIRLSASLGIFLTMIGWERISPRRKLNISLRQRWSVNLGLALFNMTIMSLTLGGIAYLSAVHAADISWGLLNQWRTPTWLSIIVTLLFLDFALYCQHILTHKWPPLWRLHQIHHTDLEFDATTAVRFHPLEIMLSMLYKAACIYLIGAHPMAVIAFEIILNGAATFNHSNVYIPPAIDRKLRWLIITPDMHRVHHSTVPVETDSNYGFSISWWDRLCNTYTPDPRYGQTAMPIGLNAYRSPKDLSFARLLLLPFKALKRG